MIIEAKSNFHHPNFHSTNMTNEWLEWNNHENRIRTPLRGGHLNTTNNNQFLNNNHQQSSNYKLSTTTTQALGMGLKPHHLMKTLQKPRGKKKCPFIAMKMN
jgi:hypothetical protein